MLDAVGFANGGRPCAASLGFAILLTCVADPGFFVGVSLSWYMKTGRLERLLPRPLLWTIGVQAVAMTVIAFVPARVPHSYVTVPISFLAALQIGLFRSVGDLPYMPIATTGNLLRFVEAGYDGFADNPAGRRAVRIYAMLITAFTSGALVGGIASHAWDGRAILIPAALFVLTGVVSVRPVPGPREA